MDDKKPEEKTTCAKDGRLFPEARRVGEPFLRYEGSPLRFVVERFEEDDLDGRGFRDEGKWQARLLDRGVVYVAATKEEAISELIKGTAECARKGYFDPAQPLGGGVGPIQHCLAILSEHLDWHIERRKEAVRDRRVMAHEGGYFEGASYTKDEAGEKAARAKFSADARYNPLLTHHSESIASLGVAISALARIKDL